MNGRFRPLVELKTFGQKGTVKLSSMRASRQAPSHPSESKPNHKPTLSDPNLYSIPSYLIFNLKLKLFIHPKKAQNLPELQHEPVFHPCLSLFHLSKPAALTSAFQHVYPTSSGLQHLTPQHTCQTARLSLWAHRLSSSTFSELT